MDDEQIMGLLVDGGPASIEAFNAWMTYQYITFCVGTVAVTVFMAGFGYLLHTMMKDL